MSSIKIEYILIAALIVFAGVFLYQTIVHDSEFSGADGMAEDLIYEIDPDFEPIFEPIWEPPGSETEALLFCLQGAIGALIIGWFFGYYYGLNKGKKQQLKA